MINIAETTERGSTHEKKRKASNFVSGNFLGKNSIKTFAWAV